MTRGYSSRIHALSRESERRKKVNWTWIGLLTIWAIFLTGILSDLGGSPGLLQSWKLNSLLQFRKADLASIEREMARLDAEKRRLEENSVVQEREIRRVLGYAAKDELIFDFSPYNAKR